MIKSKGTLSADAAQNSGTKDTWCSLLYMREEVCYTTPDCKY
jgi:hypothetical protein